MLQTQTLSSGLIVRQDFTAAVRPVFFQTEFEEFLYATHGGTLFLVVFAGRVYALTCHHVFKDFRHGTLIVTDEKFAKKGSKPAHVIGMYSASAFVEAAVDTDVHDICVIEFDADFGPSFFKGSAYILDEGTAVTSLPGHHLLVAGVIKERTFLTPPEFVIGYQRMEFADTGPSLSDPTLRRAAAQYENPGFSSVTGISGAPVFNRTTNKLTGMVVRGGMDGHKCEIHYIDIFDIMRFLEAINAGLGHAYYRKTVLRPRESP